ncbi:hypothetical protein HYPSUDRAFT_71855 [Hypholoma sublateritium FD-334 SS-4]|uniref:Uncharacterized protein n=1 Tax=Hypholoma sublateritium (strain FD-334 SS-4) TaxID=945553 RepID=A0A0D2NGD5_HYPSF|nr:hypothetical protein HYPSUDRAFT_71855 [Hypholoma sublateritium FD-334 SS-4]
MTTQRKTGAEWTVLGAPCVLTTTSAATTHCRRTRQDIKIHLPIYQVRFLDHTNTYPTRVTPQIGAVLIHKYPSPRRAPNRLSDIGGRTRRTVCRELVGQFEGTGRHEKYYKKGPTLRRYAQQQILCTSMNFELPKSSSGIDKL